jgi:hypothetical protein
VLVAVSAVKFAVPGVLLPTAPAAPYNPENPVPLAVPVTVNPLKVPAAGVKFPIATLFKLPVVAGATKIVPVPVGDATMLAFDGVAVTVLLTASVLPTVTPPALLTIT